MFFRSISYTAKLEQSSWWGLETRSRLTACNADNYWMLLEEDVEALNNYSVTKQEKRLSFVDD
jgi:hypothetical protein